MRFCEISGGTKPITATIIRTLCDPRIGSRFEEYMFTCADTFELDAFRLHSNNNRRMLYKPLDNSIMPTLRSLKLRHYDIVIMHGISTASSEVLHHVQQLLKFGGTFILAFTNHSPHPWDQLLDSRDFFRIETIFANSMLDDNRVILATNATSSATLNGKDPTVSPIVVLDNGSSLQTAIAHEVCLELGIEESSCLTLSDAGALARQERHSYIMLCGLEASFLRNIQEDKFKALQDSCSARGY